MNISIGVQMNGKRTFTRKASLAGGSRLYKAWKEYAEGDFVVGKFLGTHTDQFGKVCIVLNVLDCEFAGDSAEKFIDKELVINACGTITKLIEEEKFQIGSVYQVTYNGLFSLTKGKFAGKDAHSVSIDEVELSTEEDSDENYL